MSVLKKAEGQDQSVINNVNLVVSDLNKLTNDQIAILSFELFHEARKRGAVEPE